LESGPEELAEPQEAPEEAPEGDTPEVIENAEPELEPEKEPRLEPEKKPRLEPENSQEEDPMPPSKSELMPEPIEKPPDKSVFQVERISPPTVVLPNGEVVACKGQAWELVGAYTKDQVEELIKEHGGKGTYGISARDYRSSKVLCPSWLFKVENGEVNIPGVLSDMYPLKARQLIKAGLLSPDGVLADFADAAGFNFEAGNEEQEQPERPEAPRDRQEEVMVTRSGDESPEATMLRKELEELQQQQSVEQLRATVAEQRRMVHERSVRRKQVEAEVDEEISSGRPPPFRRRRHREEEGDDPDRPMTRAEQELAMLKAQMAAKPGDGGLGVIANMMIESAKSNAEIMKEVSKASQANESRNRELMMEIMKTSMEKSTAMAAQSDKQFELMIKMLGLKEDNKKGELDTMIRLMEFGANMSQSGSAEGVPWWQELLGGIGQLGGVVAEKLGGGKPAMVPAGPQAMLPAGNPPALIRAPQAQLPGAVHVDPSEVQSAEAVVLPGEPTQSGGQPVEDALGTTVNAIIEAILAQKDTKPNAADWVEIAYQDLPYEVIKRIAAAQDPKELLPLAEPYITWPLKLKAGAIIQGDPAFVPWLKSGFEELQAMCREQVAEREPATAAPQADNVIEEKREG